MQQAAGKPRAEGRREEGRAGSAAAADARNSNYAYESGRIVKARAPAAINQRGDDEDVDQVFNKTYHRCINPIKIDT